MIDTIRLRLTNYDIDPNAELTIQPADYDLRNGSNTTPEPILFRDATGAVINGAKAYLNTERLNFDIQPITPRDSMFDQQATAAFVRFSVPKVATGSNATTTDRDGLIYALDTIQADLQGAGIQTDLKTAVISRLDLAKSIEAEQPFKAYAELFGTLSASRKNRRDYGTTFLWENTQQECCVYDKRLEMLKRGETGAGLPENYHRYEYRMLKPRKVAAVLNLHTTEQLIRDYRELKPAYDGQMTATLFRLAPGVQIACDYNGLESRLAVCIERNPRNGLNAFIREMGLKTLAITADIETLKSMVRRLTGDRKKAWRFGKQLEQYRLDYKETYGIPIADLYREIKTKVLAA